MGIGYPEVIHGASQPLKLSQYCFFPHPSQFILDSIHYTLQGNDSIINPLNTNINPICPLLALLGAHHILHVSR
jgi:hypothetical protein